MSGRGPGGGLRIKPQLSDRQLFYVVAVTAFIQGVLIGLVLGLAL